MGISILRAGLQDTVQDLGRNGYAHLGISSSGAADAFSLRIGNLLVGNYGNAAGIEVTLVGGKYKFTADTFIALSGSEFQADLNGVSFPFHRGKYVQKDEILTIGPTQNGARCYLAVRGGIDVPDLLSAKTTHVVSGLGGYKGRSLQKGDTLSIGNLEEVTQVIDIKVKLDIKRDIIRINNGLQSKWFDGNSWSSFTDNTYFVSESSSRMGIRLSGESINSTRGHEIITEGIPLGAIQIPGGGQPIISFVEHQTTGGYPKIANVINSDLCKVGQLKPGDQIQFQSVSLEEAETLKFEQEAFIKSLKNNHA